MINGIRFVIVSITPILYKLQQTHFKKNSLNNAIYIYIYKPPALVMSIKPKLLVNVTILFPFPAELCGSNGELGSLPHIFEEKK